jgi:hypothetical protein
MADADRSHNIEYPAATHIGRLFEQREMLMRAVEALLKADRTRDSEAYMECLHDPR